MLVCVTGGTGFVGAHSIAAILAAGHRVRALVRPTSLPLRALDALGVDLDRVDVTVGDVTDEAAVRAAVRGADAVLHSASVYSFDPRRRPEIRRTNERGTELVLAAAREGGTRVVYVSTFGALLPTDQPVLGTDAPVGTATEPYLASKAAGERIARRHQADGAPVVITYPPGLLGPHDPNLGDQNGRLRDLLRGLMPMWPRGGFPIGDVRDTAALHASLLTEPPHHNRVFAPGRYLTTRDYVRTVRAITGRALPAVFLPARPMVPVGRMAGVLQQFWPWHIPAEHGAIYTCATAVPVDAPAGTEFTETVADTVRWLVAAGHLPARSAGRAALSESDSAAYRGGQLP